MLKRILARGLIAVAMASGSAMRAMGWLNPQRSLRMIRPEAERGNDIAQYVVGFAYASGQGVSQDFAEAVKWYRLAADQGNAAAQYELGLMYRDGKGVRQDYAEAHMLFSLAVAREGDLSPRDAEIAVINRDVLSRFVTPDQLAEAQRLVLRQRARRQLAEAASQL